MTASAASSHDPSDLRADHAYRWACQALGLPQAQFASASVDASFRRYFRLSEGARSWIVMDAPPDKEDCRPFLHVAQLLRRAGLHVPQVLAQDLDHGYLLLSDLGTLTMLQSLQQAPDEQRAERYFEAAIDSLIAWQRASAPEQLPPYDDALLRREANLFSDWYLPRHLGISLDAADTTALQTQYQLLIDAALAQPKVYVHRDYMLRNLMPGVPKPGILDFQDAVYGPLAYDVTCLFKDAFISWPDERIGWGLRRYHELAAAAGLQVPAWPQFQRDSDWIGLHRHLKVIGVFARLTYRDGKHKYVADTPRFVRYVMQVLPRYPELAPLRALFEKHVLPRVELAP